MEGESPTINDVTVLPSQVRYYEIFVLKGQAQNRPGRTQSRVRGERKADEAGPRQASESEISAFSNRLGIFFEPSEKGAILSGWSVACPTWLSSPNPTLLFLTPNFLTTLTISEGDAIFNIVEVEEGEGNRPKNFYETTNYAESS